jgi:two-component system, OmpR family, response regulator
MKVLIVDDNEEITEAVSFLLEEMSVSCTVVSDAKQGLDMIKQHQDFDIIFLDIAMPNFSGYDILDELKRDNLIESRNIVLFTASTLDEKKVLSYGVKGIIKKPISIDDMQAVIDRFKR